MKYTKEEIRDIVMDAYEKEKRETEFYPTIASCNIEFNDEKGHVHFRYLIGIGKDEHNDFDEDIFFYCKDIKEFINLFYDDNGEDFKIISFTF